jgi:phage repressor protein C with HTH and peptisase S24 domain
MTTENSGDRLRKLLVERRITPTEFAKALGVSTQVLNNWFARGVPGGRTIEAARVLGVPGAWLQLGEGSPIRDLVIDEANDALPIDRRYPPKANAELLGAMEIWDDDTPLDDDEVYVPFLKEVELSAGSGKTVVEQSCKQRLRFGKLTLRRQNVQPSEAVCVTVSGNSMDPVLPDKSTVGVDQGSTGIVDGKMYALNHAGQLRVKTLYRLPGGGVRLRSFNRDEHPDEEYTSQEMLDHEIIVLGRVFWSSVLW